MKNAEHTISDINSFDQEISIYKVLFQDKATSLLKYIIEKISIDTFQNNRARLPSILITGKEGKELTARAFSNSMAMELETIQGDLLGTGGNSGTLYENSNDETVYYISSSEKLFASSVSSLYKFLIQGFTTMRNPISRDVEKISADNKLFVFSAIDHKKVNQVLYKAINYHCYLQKYNIEQMELIVEQRLRWCGIDYDKEIPAIIVRNGEGSISNCIRLLSVCFLIIRGDGRTYMTVKDVEIGIGLNQQEQGLVPPPPIPDDIPF